MNMSKRINFVKACSNHLQQLGLNMQGIDESNGVIYLIGTDGSAFHMHQLYKVSSKGSEKEQYSRLQHEVIKFTHAFNHKDM